MTDPTTPRPGAAARMPTDWKDPAMTRRIKRRYASETRFRLLGMGAILLSAGFLAYLIITMAWNGIGGFSRTEVSVPVDFPALSLPLTPAIVKADPDTVLSKVDLEKATARAAEAAFGKSGPLAISESGWLVMRDAIKDDPSILTRTETLSIPAVAGVALAQKGEGDPKSQAIYAELNKKGVLTYSFNPSFLSGSDATDPTQAGIWGAFKGSLLTMLVTLMLAFPVGVLSAIYLEEYAPRNRWTDLIEVSINNLAAVPSIIFGLLGLAVFLNTMNLPRSAPLVGGLTLALMTMPVIVIAGRNAIKAVPPSIRDAALGIGASPIQVVFHHVLPLALPGILTGTIIGMARALGETAPLLMIGMRAFVATPPDGITDPSSVLPVQIFLWSDEISRGFIEKTSAAIIVLLAFLLAMNGLAIYLRNKFETRW
ncbi:MAG: phosphate ABC transporter permease PstA [Sphingomonadales bacterium]